MTPARAPFQRRALPKENMCLLSHPCTPSSFDPSLGVQAGPSPAGSKPRRPFLRSHSTGLLASQRVWLQSTGTDSRLQVSGRSFPPESGREAGGQRRLLLSCWMKWEGNAGEGQEKSLEELL